MKSNHEMVMPKLNEVRTVVSQSSESSGADFDTSQWPMVLFVTLAASVYLAIIAEVAIV